MRLKLNLLSLILMIGLFTNCSMLQQKLSTEQDAKMAYKQAIPDITNTKFSEILGLRKLLKEQLGHYNVGLGFLKKQSELFKGKEKVPHDKRLTKIEMLINILDAKVENLILMYPEDWNNTHTRLHDDFKKLQDLYKMAYDKLF